MYVTITRVSGQRVTIRATPTGDPPADNRDVRSAPLCPPEQVDRTTGAIRATRLVVNVSRSFAAAVAATRPATGLSGPVAGVLAHPGIGRLLAVGPFENPTTLDHWWRWRGNRLIRTGLVCLPVTLTTAPADATGGTQ